MHKPQPLVTIAIPTYNRAHSYLPQALMSAVDQTYAHLDIVVSDNCSTDNTESFVSSFSDHRIRYFKQDQNIGAAKNFAFCLQKARGTYFLLLHDDDMIDDDFIESCINTLQHGPAVGIVRTGTRTIDGEGNVLYEEPNRVGGLTTDGFFRGWFAGRTSPYLCSSLFHTESLREIGGLKSKHSHFDDVMAEVQLAARFGRTDVRDVKASFRRHDDKRAYLRLSAGEIKNWCEESLLLLDLMCSLVSQNEPLVRGEGMRFFSRFCYRYTGMVKNPFHRLLGYWLVFRMFGYRYPPPLNWFPIYRQIRRVGSKLKRLLVAQSV